MFLIDKVRPKWTERQMQEYLNITIQDGLAKGLVGIHDGGVVPDHVEFFQRCVRSLNQADSIILILSLGLCRMSKSGQLPVIMFELTVCLVH
jgi:hypothetical protein